MTQSNPLRRISDKEFYCEVCGTGTDQPQKEQGLDFCHTQDCDWLIANVQPDRHGWRSTPGAINVTKPRPERWYEVFTTRLEGMIGSPPLASVLAPSQREAEKFARREIGRGSWAARLVHPSPTRSALP